MITVAHLKHIEALAAQLRPQQSLVIESDGDWHIHDYKVQARLDELLAELRGNYEAFNAGLDAFMRRQPCQPPPNAPQAWRHGWAWGQYLGLGGKL